MIGPDWKKSIPEDFSEASRVWVYQSNRPFSKEEQEAISLQLEDYARHWISHNRPVKGWTALLFEQFIVLMADDTSDRLCGSAVDHSIRFIKDLELQYGLELINRMNLGFAKENGHLIIPLQEVSQKLEDGTLTGEILFFNNAITTKHQLLNEWIQPLNKSFLWERFKKEAIV